MSILREHAAEKKHLEELQMIEDIETAPTGLHTPIQIGDNEND